MEQNAALVIGQSIDRCRMDIKNRRNFPHGFPFRNKAPGQFTLIQSKLSRASKSDTSLLSGFASCTSNIGASAS
jgi:hypothetical protein